jgi:hypothetical protein
MGDVINLAERHGSTQRAQLAAMIRTPSLGSLAATVTDLTAEGACLQTAPVPLPSFFLLEIAGQNVERICRVVSRDPRGLAVRFVNARTMGRSRRRRPATAAVTVPLYRSSAAQ